MHMVTVSFRIEDEIKERWDRLAEDRGLNVSQIFRQALIEKLAEFEPKGEGENRFPLTTKERLSLVLQLRTLAAVTKSEDEKKHFETQIEALTSGYEYHYPELVNYFYNGLSRRACKEVQEILDMYSELLWGFEGLKNKEGITKKDIAFPGFDGNNETLLMAYARYFLFDLKNYESLHEQVKTNSCNSHCPMLGTYRQMLMVFQTRRKQKPFERLSTESIKTILAARGY
jgi:uncharacterized protein